MEYHMIAREDADQNLYCLNPMTYEYKFLKPMTIYSVYDELIMSLSFSLN